MKTIDLTWLEKLRFCVVRIEAEAISPINLPDYAGSTFRGAFGNKFKQVVCLHPPRRQDCPSCMLKSACSYYQCFETPNPIPWHKSPFAPHPYVLEPPLGANKTLAPGEIFHFHIVLLASHLDFLPYFLFTFHEAGRMGIGKYRHEGHGRYRILTARDAVNHENLIYDGKRQLFVGEPKTASLDSEMKTETGDDIQIEFVTPTRISDRKKVIGLNGNYRDVLPAFLKALHRRLYLLVCCHFDTSLPPLDDPDFGEIPETTHSLEWYEWERYSHRQGRKMNLGGFVGKLQWPKSLEIFPPLLEAGVYLHVGKATSFGLGKYNFAKTDKAK